MLEALRSKTGSFIIWIMFAGIIAAFVLFFGPQSSGNLGCGSSDTFVIQVNDHEIELEDWRFAMSGLNLGDGSGTSPEALQRRYRAFDFLVERSLLSQAAAEAGFEISDELVEDNIKKGIAYVMGQRVTGVGYDRDGIWSLDLVERYASNWGVSSVRNLLKQQKKELLANMMRNLLLMSRVSPEESEVMYVQSNNRVTLDYVKFDVNAYKSALRLGKADYENYLATNEAKVKEKYDAEKASYTGVKPQVRARHIMVKKSAPTPPDENTEKLTEAANPNDIAKNQATVLRDKVTGGADFAEVARESSEDENSKAKGGDLGWRPVDAIGFGPKMVEAAKKLKAGEVSEVIETSAGFHVLKIEGKREGDLSFDDVKLELAEKLASDYFARSLAKRDAEAAQAKVAGGESLDDLFGEKSDEQKDEKEEDGKTGAIIYEGPNVPASIGYVAGQAGAKAETAAAGETLPTPVDLKAPKLATTQPMERSGEFVPGVGRAPDLLKDAFESLEVGSVAGKVYELDNAFVIARLKSREIADLSKFAEDTKDASKVEAQCAQALVFVARTQQPDIAPPQCMALLKRVDTLVNWVRDECTKAAEGGKILVNNDFISSEGAKPALQYRPCSNISFASVAIQVSTLFQ